MQVSYVNLMVFKLHNTCKKFKNMKNGWISKIADL